MTVSSCRRARALGDLDQSQWELGLDGAPADPWQHLVYLVLQNADTSEMFTFTTARRPGGALSAICSGISTG